MIRILLSVLVLHIVVASASMLAQGLPVETVFRRYLVSNDTSIARMIIASDSVYGMYCRAKMTRDPAARKGLFTRFIAAKPAVGVPDAYTERGLASLEQDSAAVALPDFNEAIALNSSSLYAYYFRGSAYNSLEKPDKAAADFTRAIELDSTFYIAYHMRGLARMDMKDYPNAIADFSTVIRLDNTYSLSYLMRGLVYESAGRYDDAVADWEKVIEIDPDYADNARTFIERVKKKE